MLRHLLDSKRYELLSADFDETTERNGGAIKGIALHHISEATECPVCHSTHIKKKGTYTRKVIDILDGEAIEVSITKRKYVCQNPECKTSFHVKDELDYPHATRITDDVLDQVDKYLFDHPNKSVLQVAPKFGIGRTVVEQLLKDRIREFKQQTVTFRPCILICFIPFSFHGKECCAVAGVDASQKKYLLNIYNSYGPQVVEDFVSKAQYFMDDIEISFCKADPFFIQAIKTEVYGTGYNQESVVGVLHHYVEKQLKDLCKNKDKQFLSYQLDRFKDILTTQNSKTFSNEFQNWHLGLTPEEHEHLLPFINVVQNCINEYANTTEYDASETDFGKLLQLLNKYVNDNASFDTMVYRLLYAAPSAISPSNALISRLCINNMYDHVKGTLVDFGVDIDRLYDEIIGDNSFFHI